MILPRTYGLPEPIYVGQHDEVLFTVSQATGANSPRRYSQIKLSMTRTMYVGVWNTCMIYDNDIMESLELV